MKKIIPFIFIGGIAAASFGVFAAEHEQEGRSVDTGGAHPDSSRAEGQMPYTSVAPQERQRATKRERSTGEAAAGAGRHPEEGRSVDTGGAHPDSSQAEGRMPYSSPAPERERK